MAAILGSFKAASPLLCLQRVNDATVLRIAGGTRGGPCTR
jgi:hypothetical protein